MPRTDSDYTVSSMEETSVREFVTFPATEIDGISPENMYEAGKKVSLQYPSWNVTVKCGPYRESEIGFEILPSTHTIIVDIDSLRGGIYYVADMMREIEEVMISTGLIDREDDEENEDDDESEESE